MECQWAAAAFWKIYSILGWFRSISPLRLASRHLMVVASFICQHLPQHDELLISGCLARNVFSSTAARVPRTSTRIRIGIRIRIWMRVRVHKK